MLLLLETAIMYPAPSAQQGDWTAAWLDREEVAFRSADGTLLHGWFCAHPRAEQIILLCHGNGEHVAYLADEVAFLRDSFCAHVFVFDYRGYGKSEGKPLEAGILEDGEAALAWLNSRTNSSPEQVIYWGRSLGGAVAVHLASRYGGRALVLDRTFSSMLDVAAAHFRWVPVRRLLRNRYLSEEKIAAYSGPLFQVHGKDDEIVPFQLGKRLYEAAPGENKQFIESETLGHNEPWPSDHYDRLEQFLHSLSGHPSRLCGSDLPEIGD